ncbi:MAG: Na/Pi cotransporter family protein [Lachnospiraceae bacterium]|nr:Na/Pi cotransporter family protein [Lachnospiraceae bacterium]
MDIFSVLNLIGGLALFLYGINVMGDGLKKTSGGKLESVLGKITSNKVLAVLIGAGVTAVMQSSSATTVMIVGFVNSGLMELAKSVLVIMGANIGATITPWVMSLSSIGSSGTSVILNLLKPSAFSSVLAIIGVFIILISKNTKKKNIAQIMVGFAVLMYGMTTMSDAVKPLSQSAEFGDIMMMFSNPILGTLVGVILTAVIQSSSATVGMVQVLSTSGLITYGTAIPLMIGANIGTCATCLLSSIGTSRNARRSALIHLYYNIVRGILFLVVFYSINSFVYEFGFLSDNATAVGIAFFYTCLSIASALVLFPFSKLFVKLSYLTLPVTEDEAELTGLSAKLNIKLLDERFLSSPGLAIEQAKKVACDMAAYTKEALFMSIDLFEEYKEKKAKKVIDLEEVVDHYEDELGNYLVKLSSHQMDEKDSIAVSMILHSIGDFERISDHACNIMGSAKEMHEKCMAFTKRAEEEVAIFTHAIKDIVNMAFDSFEKADMKLAANVEPLEEVIDGLNIEIKKRHVKRLRKGKCSIEMGFILSDLSTNYERVSDHCSNIALSVLQKDEEIGNHEFQTELTSKDNEEYTRKVQVFGEKYALPKKSEENH